jgi:ribose 5-phosphate isomerase B
MKVVFVSDHAGFKLKQSLKEYVAEQGFDIHDVGAFTSEKPADDYPLLAAQAGEKVAAGEFDRGIFICGTGIGMAIAANKVPGVRAAVCNDLYSAAKSREHNDANVCALGARIIGSGMAKEIVRKWLSTDFSGGRHTGRVNKYEEIEKKYKR